jgi:hypothetical protein
VGGKKVQGSPKTVRNDFYPGTDDQRAYELYDEKNQRDTYETLDRGENQPLPHAQINANCLLKRILGNELVVTLGHRRFLTGKYEHILTHVSIAGKSRR